MTDRAALIAEIQAGLDGIRGKVAQLADAPADLALAVQPSPISAPALAAEPSGLRSEGAFYDWLRNNDMLGPKITTDEFKGCNAIIRACAAARWPISFTAYALGTAYLETNHQMLPVREAYWLSASAAAAYFRRMYDIEGQRPDKARELGNLNPGDGAKYCGRGYPQMTGEKNYARAAQALDVDLVGNPDLALRPDVAAQIMVRGMSEGWFTGKKLADYLPTTGQAGTLQFVQSRRVINGTDRANDVAGFAINFQHALAAGNWLF